MGVSAATGTPSYTGTFIPEVWSGNLLVKFYASTTIAAVANTDYEGEIKNHGDKINIRQTPNININDYSKNSTLVHQRPEADIVEMDIDKAKYFDFICDDIVAYQSDIDLMSDWSDDAAQQMKITIDDAILNDLAGDATATYNRGVAAGKESGDINLGASGAPRGVTKTNILEIIVDIDTVLDEQNVPEQKRWIIIPPWFRGMIMKSDLKDASMTGDGQSILRNGRIGRIGNFTLYVSNLYDSATDGTTSDTCWYVQAGQYHALSFAAQMTEMDTLKAESTFGTIVRGLNVYGYKVLKADALVELYCYKG